MAPLPAADRMRASKAVSFSCSLLTLAGAAQAAGPAACTPVAPVAVTSIAQLPGQVRSLLLEAGPVAEPGGDFNATDLFDSAHPVPDRRLISGQAGASCILLKLERGGRGYAHALLQFERTGGRWTFAGQVVQQPDQPR
jgi:hypothetical protein